MQIETSTSTSASSRPESIVEQSPHSKSGFDQRSRETRFTIFAIPKPFLGDADRIQRNAIRSWKRLVPQAEILLLGDEPGIAEAASELGVEYLAGLKHNEYGTPSLDSAFAIADEFVKTPFLVYCNCDVILLDDFAEAVCRLAATRLTEFVAYGRRKDVPIAENIDLDSPQALRNLMERVRFDGRIDSIVCKEYFVFPRGVYDQIPPFAVGRGNWDNWMIRSAKSRSIPVIDLSEVVTAIHQRHDYSHVGRNRWKCYVSGTEARENQRLAGGRHLISGSTPTWTLTQDGLKPVRFRQLNWAFWKESHRFLRLMKNLVFG